MHVRFKKQLFSYLFIYLFIYLLSIYLFIFFFFYCTHKQSGSLQYK